VPDRLYLCETLPQTPTGKLLRRELRSMASSDVKLHGEE
jgi:acyl-coenzyme A synthetase/AMP-(fatty) acid ligase